MVIKILEKFQKDGQIDGQKDRNKDRWIERWLDGQKDRQTLTMVQNRKDLTLNPGRRKQINWWEGIY